MRVELSNDQVIALFKLLKSDKKEEFKGKSEDYELLTRIYSNLDSYLKGTVLEVSFSEFSVLFELTTKYLDEIKLERKGRALFGEYCDLFLVLYGQFNDEVPDQVRDVMDYESSYHMSIERKVKNRIKGESKAEESEIGEVVDERHPLVNVLVGGVLTLLSKENKCRGDFIFLPIIIGILRIQHHEISIEKTVEFYKRQGIECDCGVVNYLAEKLAKQKKDH